MSDVSRMRKLISALECERIELLLAAAIRLSAEEEFQGPRRPELRMAVYSLREQLADARRDADR